MINFEVSKMRILGIDPGYGITGFGLIDAQRGSSQLLRCGAITTPAGLDFPIRLQMIYNDMTELLKLSQPDAVAIEELFFGQNVTTGIGVAQSRGVILLAIQQADIPIFLLVLFLAFLSHVVFLPSEFRQIQVCIIDYTIICLVFQWCIACGDMMLCFA